MPPADVGGRLAAPGATPPTALKGPEVGAARLAETLLLRKNMVAVFGGRQIWDSVVAKTIGGGTGGLRRVTCCGFKGATVCKMGVDLWSAPVAEV